MSALPNPKDIEDDDKYAASDRFAELEAEAAGKSAGNKPEGSLNVSRGAIRVPSPDPSLLSIDDSNNIRFGRNPDYFPDQRGRRYASLSPAPPRTTRGKLWALWYRNKGLFLVLISQFFGTMMNITTRLLEMEGNDGKREGEALCKRPLRLDSGKGYHPFHILFARMGITVLCASTYMWYKKTEYFPFGMKEVRPLLIARGLFGFFGVFGMYCKSLPAQLIRCSLRPQVQSTCVTNSIPSQIRELFTTGH